MADVGARPASNARGAPAPRKKRIHPTISGFRSLASTLPKHPTGEPADIGTRFEIYKREQLEQSDGMLARNAIHNLLSNLVYPLVLHAFEGRPIPKDFSIYAVRITTHSEEKLNEILINEDVKLRVRCRLAHKDAKAGGEVLAKHIKEIVSIEEIDRDPDAAAISLIRTLEGWFGKFDLIYNRSIVYQKLRHAVKFLNDAIKEGGISLESRYSSLWSGCELLAESVLLLHNMIKPKSTHRDIKKTFEQFLKIHDLPYIEAYTEIAQIRDSLRYGPPHPDRSSEAKKKISHLLDESLEFTSFALNFLKKRQVSIDADNPRAVYILESAKDIADKLAATNRHVRPDKGAVAAT